MNHGFCKIDEGDIVLGFRADAPVFEKVQGQVYFLIEATEAEAIGYSLHSEGKGGGLLYYPSRQIEAQKNAVKWSADPEFPNPPYRCTPLKVGDPA